MGEAVNEEISQKIDTWLETKKTLLRNAHSDKAWEAIEVKLRTYLNDAGYSDKMISDGELSLRDSIEDRGPPGDTDG